MNKYAFVGSIGAVVVVLDQVTKVVVRESFQLYESVPVIDSFFHLTYVLNPGGAFGLLRDLDESYRLPFFVVVGVVAVVALGSFVRQIAPQQRWLLAALGLVLGGALGNMIDRVLFGKVTDFLDVFIGEYHWPAFNVADSGISIGMVILLWYTIFEPAPEAEDEASPGSFS